MSYKVESDFIEDGYRCVVIMGNIGHRCGYVGIPKEHPLHGVEYSDGTPVLKTSDMQEIEIENAGLGQLLGGLCGEYQNENLSPEMFFNVHGGITYSGGGRYPVESDGLWWFGYDCAHWGDAKDISAIENEISKRLELEYPSHGVIRTKEYCEQECRNLAKQLKLIERKGEKHN